MPSEKILKNKQQVVAEIAEEMKNATTVVFVDARGLTVEEDTELRVALRKNDVKYKVRKNTLALRAAESLGYTGLEEYLKGPTTIACAPNYTDAAKILSKYEKKFNNLTIKGGILEGNAVDPKVVKQLADLPSREMLLARLMGALNSPVTKLAIAIKAIADKDNEGGNNDATESA